MGTVLRDLRVLGAMAPAFGSQDSRTSIRFRVVSSAPHRRARSSPYLRPAYRAVAQIARSLAGSTSSSRAATLGAMILTSVGFAVGSSRSRVGLTGSPSRAALDDRSPGEA